MSPNPWQISASLHDFYPSSDQVHLLHWMISPKLESNLPHPKVHGWKSRRSIKVEPKLGRLRLPWGPLALGRNNMSLLLTTYPFFLFHKATHPYQPPLILNIDLSEHSFSYFSFPSLPFRKHIQTCHRPLRQLYSNTSSLVSFLPPHKKPHPNSLSSHPPSPNPKE